MPTTIVDIANELRLSKSTVSRALSGSLGVSKRTRALVKAKAHEMNYSVNRMAQQLVSQRSHTIGFMIPDISDSFFPPMAVAVENCLEQAGYTISYMNVQRDSKRSLRFLTRAEENHWDGVFITLDDWNPEICQKLASMTIPIISLRRKVPASLANKIPYVDSNHFEGIERGIRYLISLGHKHIGYIGVETLVGKERLEAYVKSIQAHNLPEYVESNFPYQDQTFRIQVGYASTGRLLDKYPQITAIFAGDDQLALGAIQYCQEHDIKIPEQLSVLGYDDRGSSKLFCVQLSTIRQEVQEIGNTAGNLMIRMIEKNDEDTDFACINVPTTLKIRRTTGTCRNTGTL